ncbi:hypothetical protein PA598K_06768 [Paenibacillus sp. 598K]|uniref:hypothetical protein n=1 Tax=Paenibacillus sp. 598K TaxID=1117987 RepID=UPI000FFAF72C|nr:hypothetical protein [Paenibacillus sp. 598K]GBF78158.1 hypothetical protein PA598K_06768 [Paenibacillus sp. 598K]
MSRLQNSWRKFTVVAMTASVMLTGCSGAKIDNEVSSRLLKSAKTMPEGVHDQLLAEAATTEEEMARLWARYGYEDELPRVDFDEQEVHFFGLVESGSCPLKYEGLGMEGEGETLILHLSLGSSACTDDATPRSYVVRLDKTIGERIELVGAVEWRKSKPFQTRAEVPLQRGV